ncbi:MAG: hypothetical protein AAGM45_04605 [Cyanobacteria bacterium J06588_5]
MLRFPSTATRLPADSPNAVDVYRQVKVRSLINPNGKQGGWVVIIRDVTLEKQQQLQLEKLAYVDRLTGCRLLSGRRRDAVAFVASGGS